MGAAFLALVLLLGVYRVVTGRSLGLKTLAYNATSWAINPIKMVLTGREIAAESKGDFTNIVFLHHSTGNNLIDQSNLREMLSEEGYRLWDHHYNETGLRNPDGIYEGYNYRVPGDNTNPDGFAEIFSQPELTVPLNTFSALMQHEVIIYKSCFRPANHIASDAQLQQYKDWYIDIHATMAAHPDRVFVLMTIPPLNPAETNPDEAARARTFAEWMLSDEFLAGQRNVFVFDFYGLLAEHDPSAPDYGMLRADFRDGDDSHPNQKANETIGPIFAEFLKENIANYRSALASD